MVVAFELQSVYHLFELALLGLELLRFGGDMAFVVTLFLDRLILK